MNGFRKVYKAILVSGLFILMTTSCIANANALKETKASIQTHSLKPSSVNKVLTQAKVTPMVAQIKKPVVQTKKPSVKVVQAKLKPTVAQIKKPTVKAVQVQTKATPVVVQTKKPVIQAKVTPAVQIKKTVAQVKPAPVITQVKKPVVQAKAIPAAIQVKTEPANVVQTKVLKSKQEDIVRYNAFSYKKDMPKAAGVYINDKQVAYFIETEGGFSPEQRAKSLVSRINQFISQNGDPKTILPGFQEGFAVGRVNKDSLFTADSKVAQSLHITNAELARQWVNNIRIALGAPKFAREKSLIASRSGISVAFSRKYIEEAVKITGKEQFGVASWYGGLFHGRRAADGSRFSKYNFTAAHKTLPFGSVVKVTNLRNSKTCIVKITDRGPFIPGRIIDLSTAAAKEIGMFSSGISKVKVELIGRS